MIKIKQNGFLTLERLSNIELYYTPPSLVNENEIILKEEEFHHSVNVMRNKIGEKLFVTDGEGNLFQSEISSIKKSELIAIIKKRTKFENKSKDIWYCIPNLKNPDRMKFTFEKCVELGITNFILFSSKNCISKNLRPGKFQKTVLGAMKQSLRTYLPKIKSAEFSEIIQLNGTIILFDQNAQKIFDGIISSAKPVHFLFGPEGGFDEEEINRVETNYRFTLSSNRLRSETAIIKCASLLNI
jgi:16S rRNA (uracil1498-N3)-methyltransferase